MPVPNTEERSTFDNFLLADEQFAHFKTTSPIDRYHDYYSSRVTFFLLCHNVIFWWDMYGTLND